VNPNARAFQISSANPRNFDLSDRTWLCIFHLEDWVRLASLHSGDAIAIGLTRGMYLFALAMIVVNLAAFGPYFGRLFLAYPQRFRAAFPEKQLSP
jgi:hypothetical protein